MRTNEITRRIIASAFRVHSGVGPGLLESAYRRCLAVEMASHRLGFHAEHPLPLVYAGQDMACGYRADFIVKEKVVVEVKSAIRMEPVFTAQMLTYLRLSGCRVGLLLNFNVSDMRKGVKRVVLGFADEPVPPP